MFAMQENETCFDEPKNEHQTHRSNTSLKKQKKKKYISRLCKATKSIL